MGTKFTDIYNCFLGRITDDMYMEMTPMDTVKDLQKLLIHAIPNFEFPRPVLIDNYTIETVEKLNEDVADDDFIIGYVWNEIDEDEYADDLTSQTVIVENSHFNVDLTHEEINILAIIMMEEWLQRQITSVETTRMKYTSSEFKMSSQANHLSKLLTLLAEVQRQSTHMQRLYKRRRVNDDTKQIESNWQVLRFGKYNNGQN